MNYLIEECHANVNATDEKAGASTSTTHTNTRKNGVTVADIANVHPLLKKSPPREAPRGD